MQLHRGLKYLARGTAALLLLGSASMAQAQEKTISVALHADTAITDPHLTRNLSSHVAMHHVMENLVTFDENFKIIPQLAESWEISDTGDVYTFSLRDGVVFHDGSTLDAEDIKYSLLRSKEISPNKGDYSGIETIEILDPLTVKITLSKPSSVFLAALGGPFGGYIMPSDYAEAQGGDITTPVGTGPFMWDEYRADQYLHLKRFPEYSADARFDGPTGLGGNRTALVDMIDFRILPDRSSRVTGLETGEIDFASRLDLVDFERFSASSDVAAVEVPALEWVVLWFGLNQPFTQDINFRRAVAAAVDLDAVLQIAAGGHGVANPAFMHPSQAAWYNEETGQRHNYDVDAAKALLKESGYNGEPIELLSSNDIEYMGNAALALQQQLSAIGVNIELRFQDISGLVASIYATEPVYQLGMMTSSGRFDPDQHYFRRLHSSSSVNKYANEEYDAIVEEARTVVDPAARLALYNKAQGIMMRDVPAMLLLNPSFFEAHQKNVVGFKPNASGIIRFWNVDIQ